MTSRDEQKQQELAYLADIYEEQPELFERGTSIEDSDTLRELGITIPNKDELPEGHIKVLPSDFIVEEVAQDGSIYDISKPSEEPDFSALEHDARTTYATLVKCGLSTIEAVDEIASQIPCDAKQIQYAGIKDKAAITAQRISFRGIDPSALANVSSPNFFLKDIETGKGVMDVGGLSGNRFTILVRTDTRADGLVRSDSFQQNVKQIRDNGFYNYYYTQRFGTPRLINYLWGTLVLSGEYEQAVQAFLSTTNDREIPYFQQLRQQIAEHGTDWQAIRDLMEPFPVLFSDERKVVGHLIANPTDYIGALKTIQNQVTLWVYGLSSWLFNTRLAEYVNEGKTPPDTLPLFLSRDRRDWEPYRELLEGVDLYPPPLSNLDPFASTLQLKKRTVPTQTSVTLESTEPTKEGIVISFTLPKGGYATTLLAHLVTNTQYENDEVTPEPIDIKEVAGNSASDTVAHFSNVIRAPSSNIFEEILDKKKAA